jgi:GR25 family glycosyltransferase involved in LPS biosynthesis
MSNSELGCLFSHIKVFKESLIKKEPYIIVMEDDADLISWMNNNVLTYLNKNISKYDCIQLSTIISENDKHYKDCIVKNKLSTENPGLINWNEYFNKNYPYFSLWSTCCYIISYEARLKIINIFENNNTILTPADYFIYENCNTMSLVPPLISYNIYTGSTIQSNNDSSIKSNILLNQLFFKKKLLLINIWFGQLPHYFNIWLSSIKNMNYDFLLISDQILNNMPNNIKTIFMTMEDFNVYLNRETNFNVKIKNAMKIVDIKPLYGFLFKQFINNKYDYWGWSDIDMIMGDIEYFIEKNPGKDIYSNGFQTFGPLMIFKNNLLDFYKQIENYENILNDKYVCKVDEMWWFKNNILDNQLKHLNIYNDNNNNVKYYAGKNLLDFVLKKNIGIFDWRNICCGIDWNIKDDILKNDIKEYRWNYNFVNNKLFKNNIEITHSHLTLLKHYPNFISFFNENFKNTDNFSFNVHIKVNKPLNYTNYDDLCIYTIYKKYTEITYSVI